MACPMRVTRVRCYLSVGLDLPPYVIHGLCKFPGLVSLLGEGARGQATERCMRSGLIVVSPPVVNSLPGIGHGQEP